MLFSITKVLKLAPKAQNYSFNNVQKPELAASHFSSLSIQKQIHGLNLYQPSEPLISDHKKN